jgi:hypothetical protein
MKIIKTKCSKKLTINEKINIKSYYSSSENRNLLPYKMTFGFLDIWNWNLKPFIK